MDVRKYNEETRSFWEKASSTIKFENNGLWGLKSTSGEIVLKPEYDQIEFCSDFIYVHYGNRHTFYYKNGGSSDCADRNDDFRFYENGKIGLKYSDGNIFLPAIYDEIIDWGKSCDVVYARKDKEFHYYNHQHEEVLTSVEDILEDKYPECPYNLGEDQNRGVLLCVEPIEKKEHNTDCYAYNQWVRLSRIPCSKVRGIFSNCAVVEMSSDAIDHFEDKSTYIYSARVCSSMGEYPLTACINKFKSLGCYNSSWYYLLKISVNRKTKINPYDLYNVIKHFEDKTEGMGYCKFYIAIDYDNFLPDGEVRVLQIHYFWDDMGAFLDDEFLQNMLPNGTINEIANVLNAQSTVERKKLLQRVFSFIERSDDRGWDETKSVLEYLKTEGADNFTLLILNNIEINPYYIEYITPADWEFKKNIITWALKNGGQLNAIQNGKSLLERYLDDLKSAKENKEDNPAYLESVKNAEGFAQWLISKGALTTEEHRKKIEPILDGMNPQEVVRLIAKV